MGWEDYFKGRTVNVNENKAPTDESIELLKEMEEKIRSKVDETIIVSNTDFEIVINIEYDMINDAKLFRCHWKINEKRGLTTKGFQMFRGSSREAVWQFHNELLHEIVEDMVSEVFTHSFMHAIHSK